MIHKADPAGTECLLELGHGASIGQRVWGNLLAKHFHDGGQHCGTIWGIRRDIYDVAGRGHVPDLKEEAAGQPDAAADHVRADVHVHHGFQVHPVAEPVLHQRHDGRRGVVQRLGDGFLHPLLEQAVQEHLVLRRFAKDAL